MATAANYYVEARRAKAAFSKKLLLALVCFSPILYSVDTDTWREWEVALFGALTAMLGFVCGVRPKLSSEIVIILLYGVFLTFQQMLIPMTPFFGTKYGVLMAAALVPSLMLRWMDWRHIDLNRLLDTVMKAISVIIGATIVASRFLGIGETYEGHVGSRSFGFLGDSISPVIVFPILYFLFERKWLYAAAMCFVLFLTGGKAASVMLLVALLVMVVLNAHWILRPTVLAALFGLGMFVYPQIEARISPEGYEYSWNTRTISYELGWQAFERSPWYGVGINQTMKDLVSRGDELARDRGIKRYYEVAQIHNAFIRSLAETGVLGFSLLMALCFVLIHRAMRCFAVARLEMRSHLRSLAIAGSLWIIAFIPTYQTVGWFEHGHPQYAWLLLISALAWISTAFLVRARRDRARVRAAAG